MRLLDDAWVDVRTQLMALLPEEVQNRMDVGIIMPIEVYNERFKKEGS